MRVHNGERHAEDEEYRVERLSCRTPPSKQSHATAVARKVTNRTLVGSGRQFATSAKKKEVIWLERVIPRSLM